MDLNGYISLYIPSKDVDGRDLVVMKRAEVLSVVKIFLLRNYGGFTEYEAKRGLKIDGKTVIEEITIVQVFYEGEDNSVLVKVGLLAAFVKRRLNQGEVMVEQNGGISFI
jgi:hypothetical protein